MKGTGIIQCHFKGCDGKVNMRKAMNELISYLDDEQTPRCTHAIICPKCRNIIGGIDIGPCCWVFIPDKETDSLTYSIHDTKTGHVIILKDKSELDRHLKSWAKDGRNGKDRKGGGEP